MKKFALLIAMIAFVGMGCGYDEIPLDLPDYKAVPEGFSAHTSDLGWSLYYPSDWYPQRDPSNLDVTVFFTPYVISEDEFEHNVEVRVTKDWKKRKADDLKEELEAFLLQTGASKITSSLVTTLPAGEGVRVDYKAESDFGTLFGAKVGIQKGETLYAMTFIADEAGWKEFEMDFEDMLGQFRFE